MSIVSLTSISVIIVLFFCTSSIIHCIAPLHESEELEEVVNKFGKWYMISGYVLFAIFIILIIYKVVTGG